MPCLALGVPLLVAAIEVTATSDTGLGFHVAVLATAALPAGAPVAFTWRWQDGGRWEGRDFAPSTRQRTRDPADCFRYRA